jgi:Fe-S-cluster containining protein
MKDPYYLRQPLRFHCTGCGKCCLGSQEHYVEVSPEEAERIRNRLELSKPWFRKKYLVKVFEDKQGLRITEQGQCILLNEEGKCSVYEDRPMQCRTYPFWPEIVFHKKTWDAEAKKCEGINQGDVVPIETIQKSLEKS